MQMQLAVSRQLPQLVSQVAQVHGPVSSDALWQLPVPPVPPVPPLPPLPPPPLPPPPSPPPA